jgi:hypothetical protein
MMKSKRISLGALVSAPLPRDRLLNDARTRRS